MHELCRLLGEYRGHPIHLVPYALPVSGPFGIWIDAGDADYIFYQRETSPAHQDHIILHEIGHILADHNEGEPDHEVWQDLLPNISYDVITSVLRRTAYSEEHEREAEMVATIILEWSSMMTRVTLPASEDSDLGPLRSALHPRWGWM